MSNVMCASIFFFFITGIFFPISVIAVRDIPDNNLGYPVHVYQTNCQDKNNHWGSGFFVTVA